MAGSYSASGLFAEKRALPLPPLSLRPLPRLAPPSPSPPRRPSPPTDAAIRRVSHREWNPRRRSGDGPVRMEHEGAAGRTRGARHEAVTEGPSTVGEDTVWQMNVTLSESMEAGPYPERPGEPDCAYYIRNGVCRFGKTCRYNHPADRKLAIAAARIKGGYPERVGQPECQFYLKTGTCKFGATCKFHHPKDKAGIAGHVQLNILGYPLRPSAKECAYYLRTGQCKFGSTCKFHHPPPSSPLVPFRGSSVYPSTSSSTTPGQQSYPGGLTNWSLSRASYIPSPRWQGSSSYAQLILPQGLVQVPGWNAYPTQLAAVSSPEGQQQTLATAQFYGISRSTETTGIGSQGTLSSYRSGSIPLGLYALSRESVFPERPDQPECQFYMKTGDCKFGAVCRFHHPKERSIPAPNCILSPLGLPLRPGEPVCIFYSRYGICKFGPNCKYHHPLRTLTYSLPTTSSTEVPVVQHLLGSSSGPSTSRERLAEGGSGKSRGLSGDDNEADGSHSSRPAPSFS